MSDSPALPKSCPKCGAELPSEATEGLCPRCLMAEAMQPTGPKTPAGPWQPPTAEELQKLLPQYEITALLGRGGMGAVYKGTQKSLDRPVAIKILSNQLEEADASFAERFKNEARSMAKLSHPGIVAVHDFGETPDHLLYIVMEFIEGTDVSRMIAKQKRLHTEHAMAITAHVCDALAYAHERGIIHRDIKPANIMVGYDGVVKVADFGLAKMNSKAGESVGLTQSGMAMGTLHYMAPEALMLGAGVDHRADIYAVGVMLYQMLTGKVPHGMFELPSMQVAGLDPRYDGIIAKAMREDRDIRYQSATEMRYDLDHILTQPVVKVEPEATQAPAALPTEARPQRTAAQPYRPPQVYVPPPKPKSSMGGTLAWLTVIVFGGFAAWFYHQHGSTTPVSPTASTGNIPVTEPLESAVKPASATIPSPPAQTASTPLTSPSAKKGNNAKSSNLPPSSVTPAASITPVVVNAPIDLLSIIDPAKHTSEGTWKKTPDGLMLEKQSGFHTISMPLQLPPEYDFEVEFSLNEEKIGDVHQLFTVAGRTIDWTMQTQTQFPNPVYGFINLDNFGRDTEATVRHKGGHLAKGTKYRSIVRVRGGSLVGEINNVAVVSWKGDVGRFPMRAKRWNESDNIGLGATGGGILFHTAIIRPYPSSVTTMAATSLWTDTKGRSITATFKRIEGDNVLLDIAGKLTPVAMSTLSVESQKLARDMQMAAPPSAAVNLIGLWKQTNNGKSSPVYTVEILSDQKATFTSADLRLSGSWSLAANELVMNWDNGIIYRLAVPAAPAPAVLLGSGITKDGKAPFTIRFERGTVGATATTAAITKDVPFVNTLGMKFVRVPGTRTHMCIHETRRKDYAVYAAENTGVDTTWQNPVVNGIKLSTGVEHPVSSVSWEDATAFCDWLGKKEGRVYRLPTGYEWDLAVVKNLDDRSNITSAAVYALVKSQYPWDGNDNDSRPPDDAGRYRDSGKQYQNTAPVMSFKPNALGIYDLGGNVWEWCQDLAKDKPGERLFRGAGYENWGGVIRSNAWGCAPKTDRNSTSADDYPRSIGFRIVIEDDDNNSITSPASSNAGVAPMIPAPSVVQPVPAAASSAIVAATKDKPFVNTLGMQFVPVPGTKTLFCIHETRRQDYAAYAAEDHGTDKSWENQQMDGVPVGREDNHPVVHMSWHDAQRFCAWLSKKEGKKYRLPTDMEWSYAVGIGSLESWAADITPEMRQQKIKKVFPWGNYYPPRTGSLDGNYRDTSFHEKFPTEPFIDGYTDGFAATAPVMSFTPNKLGIFDLGGNVNEWCEDWYNANQTERVLRGLGWAAFGEPYLLSSMRAKAPPEYRHDRNYGHGFRVVLDISNATTVPTSVPSASFKAPSGTIVLFDGKTLNGWRVIGDASAFSVDDGAIKTSPKQATLLYTGTAGSPSEWKDFEFTAMVKTGDGANSGIWFHTPTDGSGVTPKGISGFEVQVSRSNGDNVMTGGLYYVRNIKDIHHQGDWFSLRFTVKDKTFTCYINDEKVNEWTQPDSWIPPAIAPTAIMGHGTFAIPSHKGEVWFKDIKVRPL